MNKYNNNTLKSLVFRPYASNLFDFQQVVVSKLSFLRYQTFKKFYGFDKNWPYNDNISVKLKKKIGFFSKY